jgi:transketolase
MDGKTYRVYVLMGDGEQQEGEVWEAAMAASKFKLDNLVGIIDRNGIQQDGLTEQIMPLEPLAAKWRAFNWNVIEVDGYDYLQLMDAFDQAEMAKNKPTIIIAHTVKGKGVSFMEWSPHYHGTAPSKGEMSDIFKELK